MRCSDWMSVTMLLLTTPSGWPVPRRDQGLWARSSREIVGIGAGNDVGATFGQAQKARARRVARSASPATRRGASRFNRSVVAECMLNPIGDREN